LLGFPRGRVCKLILTKKERFGGGLTRIMASIIYMIIGKIDPINITIRFKQTGWFGFQMVSYKLII